jgi:hypothetical protein
MNNLLITLFIWCFTPWGITAVFSLIFIGLLYLDWRLSKRK